MTEEMRHVIRLGQGETGNRKATTNQEFLKTGEEDEAPCYQTKFKEFLGYD